MIGHAGLDDGLAGRDARRERHHGPQLLQRTLRRAEIRKVEGEIRVEHADEARAYLPGPQEHLGSDDQADPARGKRARHPLELRGGVAVDARDRERREQAADDLLHACGPVADPAEAHPPAPRARPGGRDRIAADPAGDRPALPVVRHRHLAPGAPHRESALGAAEDAGVPGPADEQGDPAPRAQMRVNRRYKRRAEEPAATLHPFQPQVHQRDPCRRGGRRETHAVHPAGVDRGVGLDRRRG